MGQYMKKLVASFTVLVTMLSQVNIPIMNAQETTTVVEEQTTEVVENKTIDNNDENVEIIKTETQVAPTTRIGACNMTTDTIEDCFGNTAWANVVVDLVGAANTAVPFTQVMADTVTMIQGSDLMPHTYTDSDGNFRIPEMTGLAHFRNLIAIQNFWFSGMGLKEIGDLSSWDEASSVTIIDGIDFSNNDLENIGDLGNWNFPNLGQLTHINFSNNKLTNIGDLGNWNLPALLNLADINFSNNELTNIGDLGNWDLPTLIFLEYINFSNNELTTIGDLGLWPALNHIPTVMSLKGINFSNNNLTTIGDLHTWQAFPAFAFGDVTNPIDFSGNKLAAAPVNQMFVTGVFKQVYMNFSNQKIEKSAIPYLNSFTPGAPATEMLPAHNGMNNPTATYGIYGLIPDQLETFTNTYGLSETAGANQLPAPYELAVPYTLGDTHIKYTVTQHQGTTATNWSAITGPSVWYSAEISHPINYVTVNVAATDFTINVNNLATQLTNPVDAILLASATTTLVDEFGVTSNPTPTVNATELAAIQALTAQDALPQTLPLTFTYTYGPQTATKTIDVTISDNTAPTITFAPKNVSHTLGTPITNADIIAGVTWSDVDDAVVNQPITIVNANASDIAAINVNVPNIYQVNYTVTDNAGVSTTLPRYFVVGAVFVGNLYAVFANDFTIDLADVSALTATTAKNFANLAATVIDTNVDITSLATVNGAELTAIQNTTTAGTYPLTFNVTHSGEVASYTIDVVVTSTPIPTTINLTANNFAIALTSVATLTTTTAKTAANVTAIELPSNTNITASVSVDLAELAIIQATTVAGTYPLTFNVTHGGKTASKTINVMVTSVTPPVTGVAITANNFTIALENATTLTATTAKAAANVVALELPTNADITTSVNVNNAELTAIQTATVAGTYPLTFTITHGGKTASKTINVTVTDTLALLNVIITANDFSITYEDYRKFEADGTLAQEILTKSNAKAYETTTNTEVAPIQVDTSQVKDVVAGKTYPITLSYTPIGTSRASRATSIAEVTINVTIAEGLVNTGEQTTETLVFGITLGLISSLLLFGVYYRKRKTTV